MPDTHVVPGSARWCNLLGATLTFLGVAGGALTALLSPESIGALVIGGVLGTLTTGALLFAAATALSEQVRTRHALLRELTALRSDFVP